MPSLKNSSTALIRRVVKRKKEGAAAPSAYRRNKQTRPKTMTWGKASIPLALSVVFDLLRLACEFLYLFAGPFGLIADVVGLLGWLTVGMVMLITNARIFKENASSILWCIVSFIIDEVPIVGGAPATSYTVWKLYHKQITDDNEALRQYEKEQAESIRLQQQQQAMAYLGRIQATQQAQFGQQQEEEAIEAANDAQFDAAQTTAFQEGEAANDALYGGEYAPKKIHDEVRKAA
jgi:hypothetical protein